jgi:hypothetical protein
MTRLEPTPPAFRKYAPVWNAVVRVYPDVPASGPVPLAKFMAEPPYTPAYQGF